MDRKSAEMSEMEREISALKEKVKQLEEETDSKSKEAKAAEENAMALKKQSDGFLLEYDRLLEDNQNLRTQYNHLNGDCLAPIAGGIRSCRVPFLQLVCRATILSA